MNHAAPIKAKPSTTTRMQIQVEASVNHAQVLRDWLVGAWIVELEQLGKDGAKFEAKRLETLASNLQAAHHRGLGDPRVLRDCRVPYQIYPQIRGSATRELPPPLSPELLLRLSWTKLQDLIRIDDTWKRAFLQADRDRPEHHLAPSAAPQPRTRKAKPPLRQR